METWRVLCHDNQDGRKHLAPYSSVQAWSVVGECLNACRQTVRCEFARPSLLLTACAGLAAFVVGGPAMQL